MWNEIDKDKVIKGLDYCLCIDCIDGTAKCPYYYNDECSKKLYNDVMELISRYEDAVKELDELHGNDGM